MNVRALIEDLEKIEDKDLEVVIHAGVSFNRIRRVSVQTINNKYDAKIDDKTVAFLHRGDIDPKGNIYGC